MMLKSEEQTADGRRQTAGTTFLRRQYAGFDSRLFSCLLLSAVCLLSFACRRDMQDQPKMKPFRSSPFFRDGLSTRPPIEGTIARGYLKTDTEFFTGK